VEEVIRLLTSGLREMAVLAAEAVVAKAAPLAALVVSVVGAVVLSGVLTSVVMAVLVVEVAALVKALAEMVVLAGAAAVAMRHPALVATASLF